MIGATPPERIVLIGLSGSGKTVVARRIADRLGWQAVDTDALVASMDGRSLPRIFRESGEVEFRRLERLAVAQVSGATRTVVATGGGAVLDPDNRACLWRDAFVVHLEAGTETLLARLAANPDVDRPLLAGDARGRLVQLRAERGPLYALADWTVRTDGLTPDDVADEVITAWQRHAPRLLARPNRLPEALSAGRPTAPDPDLAAEVTAAGGAYPVYAGWNVLERLPGWLRAAGLGPVVHVIADRRVAELHGERLLGALAMGGFEVHLHSLPLDEAAKSLETAAALYDRLVAVRAERRHVVLAFGGGVATDLGGFVAATYLRGMPLVQVPTSLLGMVDAAIGGKVAVNHREGKNLIGAFYQPRLVVADAALLRTLPRRELISGWAEVIKHALILDPELLAWLEADAEALLALEPEPLVRALRRSIAVKARIVSADEREDGLRMVLNYGHTVGHALEAATGYATLLHGEAVAVGMAAEAAIAVEMGLIGDGLAARQNALVERFGLPLRAPGVAPEAVLDRMRLDKKVSGRTLRFVLLAGPGCTVVRSDVPDETVRRAVALATGASR
jgi:shikimate kinase/3-dehydroquinate synthase